MQIQPVLNHWRKRHYWNGENEHNRKTLAKIINHHFVIVVSCMTHCGVFAVMTMTLCCVLMFHFNFFENCKTENSELY